MHTDHLNQALATHDDPCWKRARFDMEIININESNPGLSAKQAYDQAAIRMGYDPGLKSRNSINLILQRGKRLRSKGMLTVEALLPGGSLHDEPTLFTLDTVLRGAHQAASTFGLKSMPSHAQITTPPDFLRVLVELEPRFGAMDTSAAEDDEALNDWVGKAILKTSGAIGTITRLVRLTQLLADGKAFTPKLLTAALTAHEAGVLPLPNGDWDSKK